MSEAAREMGRRSVSISRTSFDGEQFHGELVAWRSSQSPLRAARDLYVERRLTGKIAWAHLKELSDYYTR